MNYFFDIRNRFDKNLIVVTAVLSIGFGIRNTCVLGWVPLLLLKMIQQRALISYLKAFAYIFLPILAIVILSDSYFYGELTFTPYNFIKVNILERKSECFGVHKAHEYITSYAPFIFKEQLLLIVPAFLYNVYVSISQRTIPIIAIFFSISLLVVSLVPHKEMRFSVPFLPFIFMIIGQFTARLIKFRFVGKFIGILVLISAVVNVYRIYEFNEYKAI